MNTKRNRLTADHRALYLIIPEGRDNACNGTALASVMGCSERRIRQMVEDLTVNGNIVCNLQNGKGYYRPLSEEDIDAMLKLTASRAYSLLRKKYALKRALERFHYNGSSLFVQS